MNKILSFAALILLISGNSFMYSMFSGVSKIYSSSSSNLPSSKKFALILLKNSNKISFNSLNNKQAIQKSYFSAKNNFSKKNEQKKQKRDYSDFNQQSSKSSKSKSKNKAFKFKQKIFLKLGSLGAVSLGIMTFNFSDIKKSFLVENLGERSLDNLTLSEIEPAFKCAIETGCYEAVKQLLTNYDIDINAQDEQGYTALMLAAFYGHIKISELLLAYPGIKVDIRNRRGETATDLAHKREHEYIYNLLLSDHFFQF